MNLRFVLTLVVVFAVVLAIVSADQTTGEKRKRRPGKKLHRKPSPGSAAFVPPAAVASTGDDAFKLMEKDEAAEQDAAAAAGSAQLNEADSSVEENPAQPPSNGTEITDNRVADPCAEVHCGAGRVCAVQANEEPECVCVESCPVEEEPRRKVCSNHNETWPSDCAVYQQRCWCDTGDERCRGEDFKHIHIEYYGTCRDMPECSDGEMADFPRRMRDWLFNVMRDLADRHELPEHYMKMEQEAETNLTLRWTNAAVWKWCDLDGHPPDRSVSRHELFPIRAPLMSLEHCIAPFLNSCDVDENHKITLQEWAKCLELDQEDIEEKCDEIAAEE